MKIYASDGMRLTNGVAFGKVVELGVNSKPEDWHEISEEEYNKSMKISLGTEGVVDA